jgi:hypothetical protein
MGRFRCWIRLHWSLIYQLVPKFGGVYGVTPLRVAHELGLYPDPADTHACVCSMANVKFYVPQWTGDVDRHADRMSSLCDYVHMALFCGFRAIDIGEHITNRWPSLILGGLAAAVRLAEISAFAAAAQERGLVDEDIGTEIDIGWADAIPGGVEVSTASDGTIWVMSRRCIYGELPGGGRR